MGRFRAGRGGVQARLDDTDVALLRQLLGELLELLGDDQTEDDGDDPLAAAVGIGTATKAPGDPVLARLFPDGYSDDPEASADFRRYTERGLRDTKRANVRAALATLDELDERGRARLDRQVAQAWLGALNDMRLAIGTRLDIGEDWDEQAAGLPDDDPRAYVFAVYDHLTWLQETLVQALLARP